MAKSLRTFLFLLLLPAFAEASVYFEPYAALGWGNWKQERTVPPDEMELAGNSQEFALGARAFWVWRFLFVGLNYENSNVRWSYTKIADTNADDGWNISAKGTAIGYGPVLGFRSQGGFRVWVSLSMSEKLRFSSELDPAEAQPEYIGSGQAVALAFPLGKWISVGAEYQMKKYGKLRQNGTTVSLPGPSTAGSEFHPLTRNVLKAFVSFPLDLF